MKLTTLFLIVTTFISCTKKEVIQKVKLSSTNIDSLNLLKHVDSLKIDTLMKIDLSAFKNKKLKNLNFKLIPTELEGGIVDLDSINNSFDLTDESSFANWKLISKKPKFFTILTDEGFLVTLNYKLEKIDAIRFGYIDPASNNHWSFSRQGKIDKNLNILLHHEYSVQVDENWNFEKDTLDKHLYINSKGTIEKK